jgi:C-terminal processing protease CtpA/Prc
MHYHFKSKLLISITFFLIGFCKAGLPESRHNSFHANPLPHRPLGESGRGQSDSSRKEFSTKILDAAQMRQELDFLEKKLKDVHPEPFHYLTEVEFNNRLSGLRNSLPESMNREKWYLELARLIASLHDGHTAVFYPDDFRREYFQQGGKIMPFRILLQDDFSVQIQDNFTTDSLLDSARLLEINAKPVDELIGEMRKLTFGESDVFRNAQVSRYFGRMYWFLYGHTDSLRIKLRLNNGSVHERKLPMLSDKEYDEVIRKKYPQGQTTGKWRNMVYTPMQGRSVGRLSLMDFNLYKGYKDSIRAVFKSMAENKTDTLLLDLRGNGGGEFNITEEINHYLLDTPWVLVSRAKIKMSDDFYAAFPKVLKVLKFLPKNLIIRLASALMTKNTRIRKTELSRDAYTRIPSYQIYTKPRKHFSRDYFFRGKVFLFTDRHSYSMSGMFAAIMKDYGRAVLVGEETGGLANPHGATTLLKLPVSGFSFSVSTARAYRPSGIFDDAGVKPDVPVAYDKLSRARTTEQMLELMRRK